jgi:hypothetical protein
VLFLQRSPGGTPPAWRTGRAEPWPSSADLRAQRQRAMAEQRGEPVEAEPEAEPVGAQRGPSPATAAAKRKRKRR